MWDGYVGTKPYDNFKGEVLMGFALFDTTLWYCLSGNLYAYFICVLSFTICLLYIYFAIYCLHIILSIPDFEVVGIWQQCSSFLYPFCSWVCMYTQSSSLLFLWHRIFFYWIWAFMQQNYMSLQLSSFSF